MPFVEGETHQTAPAGSIYGFRGGPTYRAATADEQWAQALNFQRQREQHQADQLAIALLAIALLIVAAVIYSKRRAIFAASENAVVSTLAGGVKVKRRAHAYGDRIKTQVVERADGEKASPPSTEWI